jgi:type I restriction enzyme S subunit
MSENVVHNHEGFAAEILAVPLPNGWARATINELGEVRLGRQRSPKNRSIKHPTKYIRAANLTWNGLDLSDILDMEFRPNELEIYRLHPGDILISEASGSAKEVGKSAIWNNEIEDCCFQNTVIRFRSQVVSPKFAHVAFTHFAKNGIFSRASKGVGIQHLSADRFSILPFLLPPAKEQVRIVEKVDELFSDLDAGVAALERIRAKLKRYRAAVLKAAVEGKLTADWRAKHLNGEHAADLLKRILAVRRRKWEEDQLAKYTEAGREPPKGWREKYQERMALFSIVT